MEPPTFLAEKNSHDRDSHISFEEGPHIYTIDGDSDYTSVTKWNHSHFPKFDADLVIGKMMASPRWPQSPYFGMSKDEIKTKWKDDGTAASEAGTIMHYDIECFYNEIAIDAEKDSLEWKYFREFHDEIGSTLLPYRTEWMVWDRDLRLAGSIDMIFENEDGTLQLYDWKRAKEIKKENKWDSALVECISHLPNSNFWHYSLQLNTYKYILEKNYGKKVTNMFLVGLHPNNKNNTYMRYEVSSLTKEMDDLVELRKKSVNFSQSSTTSFDTSSMTAEVASETIDKLVNIKNKRKELLADMDSAIDILEAKLIHYSKDSGLKSFNGKDYKVTINDNSDYKVPDKKDLRRYELENVLKELDLWSQIQEMSAYRLKSLLKSESISSEQRAAILEYMDEEDKTKLSLKKL